MDYKEKAKAYDEALKQIKECIPDENGFITIYPQEIFPELTESEDERIRKELLEHCKNQAEPYIQTGNKYPQIQSWIAWLEKQGELVNSLSKGLDNAHERIDKLIQKNNELCVKLEKQSEQKHKFNIGDIISNGQAVFRIENIIKNCIGQDCYFLVNVEDEKKGLRYLILTDSQGNHSHFGEITWLCEQVDAKFEKQGKQKPTNKIKPKFKVGDRLRYKEHVCDGVVTEITDTDYICGNAKLPISTQDKLELIEQNTTDKVKPKFNIGDWITNGIDVDKIIGIDLEDENYLFENNRKSDISLVDSNSHLWTIEDVKDCDVLATEDKNFTTPFVAIFKERGLDFFNSYCFIGFDGNFYEGEEGHDIENIHPATKEQCLLLFQKMHETGYEWNDEKKELKKIKANEAMYDDDKLREAICE